MLITDTVSSGRVVAVCASPHLYMLMKCVYIGAQAGSWAGRELQDHEGLETDIVIVVRTALSSFSSLSILRFLGACAFTRTKQVHSTLTLFLEPLPY